MTIAPSPAPGDPVWSLRLFDHFALGGPAGPVALTARKAVALLVFLALQRDRTVRRDTIANILWDGVETAQARVNLRQAIAAIRRLEGDHPPLIATDADTITLTSDVASDVERFARLVAGTPAERVLAAGLYRSDLVAGFVVRDAPAFNEWLAVEQAQWRQRAIDVLLSLAEAGNVPGGDVNAGVTAALKLLSIDPFNEAAYRAIMRLYARQGRAALALTQYRGLSDLLRRELQVAPEAETQALYEQIRSGRRQALIERPRLPTAPAAAAPPPVDLPDDAPVLPPRGWRWGTLALGAAVVLAGGYAAWRSVGDLFDPTPGIARVYPIAADEEDERHPALSPDGTSIVYSLRRGGNVDLYLAGVDDRAQPIRLTDDPGSDAAAAWRGDGGAIAFSRTVRGAGRCTLWVRTMPTGSERQVGTCPTGTATDPVWSGDGRILYFSDDPDPNKARRILALTIGNGEVHTLTDGGSGTLGDYDPAVSHDGTRIAFVRRGMAAGAILVRDIAGGRTIEVQRDVPAVSNVVWSAGDTGLFFSIGSGPDSGLWWSQARAGAARARLSSGLFRYDNLSVSASGRRLAMQATDERTGFLRWRDGMAQAAAVTLAGIGGGAFDRDPVLSARGRTAFVSTRSGTEQLWTIPNGQQPRMLTRARDVRFDGLDWSPGGRVLAVSATTRDRSDIWLVDSISGRIARAPSPTPINLAPLFSPDGRWLYWSSFGEGASALLRIDRTRPGAPVRVLAGPIPFSRLSPDGNRLYYLQSGVDGIWQRPVDRRDGSIGGPARRIVAGVNPGSGTRFAVTRDAIVYGAPDPATGGVAVRRRDLTDGSDRVVPGTAQVQARLSVRALPGGGVLIARATRQNDITGIDLE